MLGRWRQRQDFCQCMLVEARKYTHGDRFAANSAGWKNCLFRDVNRQDVDKDLELTGQRTNCGCQTHIEGLFHFTREDEQCCYIRQRAQSLLAQRSAKLLVWSEAGPHRQLHSTRRKIDHVIT